MIPGVGSPDDQSGTLVTIEGVMTVSVPPTLEVQSSRYRGLLDKAGGQVTLPASGEPLILQQRGLNDVSQSALGTYVRVIFRTEGSSETPGLCLRGSGSPLFSSEDLGEMEPVFREQMQAEFSGATDGQRLVAWMWLKLETVNEMQALAVHYSRQLKSNPQVLVWRYLFFNNDWQHIVDVSYREVEAARWEPEVRKVLASLRYNDRCASRTSSSSLPTQAPTVHASMGSSGSKMTPLLLDLCWLAVAYFATREVVRRAGRGKVGCAATWVLPLVTLLVLKTLYRTFYAFTSQTERTLASVVPAVLALVVGLVIVALDVRRRLKQPSSDAHDVDQA